MIESSLFDLSILPSGDGITLLQAFQIQGWNSKFENDPKFCSKFLLDEFKCNIIVTTVNIQCNLSINDKV